MAKIEMDISEYEILKENKKLLEDSLNKERELQKQIETLTNDKIKALEDAKMKVVKVIKHEKREYLLKKRTDENYMLRELLQILGIDYKYFSSFKIQPGVINRLADILFEKTEAFSIPTEEITTHGLDEIKLEIREDLQSKMDNEIKQKIQNADEILFKNNELLQKHKSLTDNNNLLNDTNKKLTERCDELIKTLNQITNYSETISKIKDILSKCNFWNKTNIIKNINLIIKEKDNLKK